MTQERVNEIAFKGSASTRDQAAQLLTANGATALIERGTPRSLIMLCPCGCKDHLIINLDGRTGPAWRLYKRRSGLTLYPSYWRESGCQSHFILWGNRILWCSYHEGDEDDEWWYSSKLDVRAALSQHEFRNYVDIADNINELPWDVLTACRQLVRNKQAVELTGKKRGWFKLHPQL